MTGQDSSPSTESEQRTQPVGLDTTGSDSLAVVPVLRGVHTFLLVGVLVVLVWTNGYTAWHNKDTLTLLGPELATLDVLYGLSLAVLALAVISAPNQTRALLGRLRQRRLVVVSGGILVVLFVVGSVYPFFAAETTVRPLKSLQPPFWGQVPVEYVPTCHGPVVDGQCKGTTDFPLGTTYGGKDVARLTLYGLNTTLQVAVTASVLALVAGVTVGTAAGYLGGWKDEVLMRYVDLQRSIPSFFAYILFFVVVGGSYPLLILVFGLLSWGGIARQVRSEVMQRREDTFVKAATLSGASPLFVIRRHILPNTSNTLVTASAVLFGKLVVFEASLAFLTLTETSTRSLGNQIAGAVGRESADLVTPASPPPFDWGLAPWVVVVPGAVLCSVLLTTGLLTDGLRDELDPRS